MTEHQQALMSLIKLTPKGTRIENILKKTGMTRPELKTAAEGLTGFITKYRTADWSFGYRLLPVKTMIAGMPARREAIPMHALSVYTGATKRAGAVL